MLGLGFLGARSAIRLRLAHVSPLDPGYDRVRPCAAECDSPTAQRGSIAAKHDVDVARGDLDARRELAPGVAARLERVAQVDKQRGLRFAIILRPGGRAGLELAVAPQPPASGRSAFRSTAPERRQRAPARRSSFVSPAA